MLATLIVIRIQQRIGIINERVLVVCNSCRVTAEKFTPIFHCTQDRAVSCDRHLLEKLRTAPPLKG